MTPLAEKSLQFAKTQLGVCEIPKGSNAGPHVEGYLRSVGLGKGYAWCMAFVYWNVQTATDVLSVKNPLKKTAGVMDQWNYLDNKKSAIPEVGDIFIMDFGKGLGHTGFVEKLLPNGKFQTIEGNTNDDGSREGYEVARRIRTVSQMKGFIRI
jgi:hypothetical protein